MANPKIFSTKKLDPALAAAARQHLELAEADAIAIELIRTTEKEAELKARLQTANLDVAFTSAHAAEAIKPFINDGALGWNIFCLQGKTRETLMQPGFQAIGTIRGTATDAAQLAEAIIDHGVERLVFFCGDRRRDELPQIVRSAGISVEEAVVYRTVEIPVYCDGPYDGLLFFSPSAVHSFFSSNRPDGNTVCFALGATTAAALSSATPNRIVTANEPSQQAMLDAVTHYFDQTNNNK